MPCIEELFSRLNTELCNVDRDWRAFLINITYKYAISRTYFHSMGSIDISFVFCTATVDTFPYTFLLFLLFFPHFCNMACLGYVLRPCDPLVRISYVFRALVLSSLLVSSLRLCKSGIALAKVKEPFLTSFPVCH